MISTLARALLVFLMWPSKKGYLMLVLSPWTLISRGLFFSMTNSPNLFFLMNMYRHSFAKTHSVGFVLPPLLGKRLRLKFFYPNHGRSSVSVSQKINLAFYIKGDFGSHHLGFLFKLAC